MNTITAEAQAELERIRISHDGFLRPEDVVEAARPESSPLHHYFDWDDSEAAAKWRLEQARRIIRTPVVIVHSEVEPIRAYVSMKQDRPIKKGYRAVTEVIKEEELRRQLLKQAMEELRAFRRKYAILKELCGIMKEIDKLMKE
ncbi:MAG: hypothetical protein QXL94_04890 [Candidatus Parvarchaeum sp.]